MFGIGIRKNNFEEEDLCCRYCEHATITAGKEGVFCKKKKEERQEDGRCTSFAYDLLKRRPAPRKEKEDLSTLEFPVI